MFRGTPRYSGAAYNDALKDIGAGPLPLTIAKLLAKQLIIIIIIIIINNNNGSDMGAACMLTGGSLLCVVLGKKIPMLSPLKTKRATRV